LDCLIKELINYNYNIQFQNIFFSDYRENIKAEAEESRVKGYDFSVERFL